jgi:hypothetical protein
VAGIVVRVSWGRSSRRLRARCPDAVCELPEECSELGGFVFGEVRSDVFVDVARVAF